MHAHLKSSLQDNLQLLYIVSRRTIRRQLCARYHTDAASMQSPKSSRILGGVETAQLCCFRFVSFANERYRPGRDGGAVGGLRSGSFQIHFSCVRSLAAASVDQDDKDISLYVVFRRA